MLLAGRRVGLGKYQSHQVDERGSIAGRFDSLGPLLATPVRDRSRRDV